MLIRIYGSSNPASFIYSLSLTALSKCFLLSDTLNESISCFILSSDFVCFASFAFSSFSFLAFSSYSFFLASASALAFFSASSFSFFSAASFAFFSDSALALASASSFAFFSASSLALAFYSFLDSTLVAAREISDFSSLSPSSNYSRLSLFFSYSIAASASIYYLTLSIWSWASAFLLWSSCFLFILARLALAAAFLAAAALVSWIAWAARNSCSFFSASSFWAASSSWSFLSSVALSLARISSYCLSFSALAILASSSIFYLSSASLCFSSLANWSRSYFCCASYLDLSSWRALFYNPVLDVEAAWVNELASYSFSPVISILCLWASSVAFLRASSIALSSWALLAPSGFLMASIEITIPSFLADSFVWMALFFGGLSSFSFLA